MLQPHHPGKSGLIEVRQRGASGVITGTNVGCDACHPYLEPKVALAIGLLPLFSTLEPCRGSQRLGRVPRIMRVF
jgi:hypothetical protein